MLTEEAFEVVGATVIRPVRVLQVPDRPLLARQEVFDLQPCGGVAARLGAEPRCDLEAAVRHRVVSRAQPGPVPEALLSAALLKTRRQNGDGELWVGKRDSQRKRGKRNRGTLRTSSAVTMAMMETPCSHTICQKS